MELQPKDTEDMATELTYMTLDTAAKGTIEAEGVQLERLDELTERLGSGEFHTQVVGSLPKECIDGRPGGDMMPNSAGGTFSLTVADDLTTQRFSKEKTLIEADREVMRVVIGEGEIVGGHCADHAEGDNCGCGAKDKIGVIYAYIANNPDVMLAQADALGIKVPQDVHDKIVRNAAARTDFPTGKELSTTLKEVAGEESESILTGAHKEVVAVINSREGTSLDREALTEVFGTEYQAFNVDAWTFKDAASAISDTDEEVEQKTIAMAYYNLAAANVLCGPGMRVVAIS